MCVWGGEPKKHVFLELDLYFMTLRQKQAWELSVKTKISTAVKLTP